MEPTVIRPARPEDAAALLAIYAPYVEKTAVTFEYQPPALEEFAGRVRRTLERFPYLAAEREGRLLGYAYASPFHPRPAYRWSVETSIYVAEDALAIPDVDQENPVRQEILDQAAERGTRVLFVRADTALELEGGRTLRLIAPLGSGDTNEEGLTVLLDQEGLRTLITGDMGADVEELLLAHVQLPETQVLVAGHHGSRYSTSQALLDRTGPAYALISVGEDNLYGRPAQETLERIASAGAEIYRTDVSGTVTVQLNET